MSHEVRASAVAEYDELREWLQKEFNCPLSYDEGNALLSNARAALADLYRKYTAGSADPFVLENDAEALMDLLNATRVQYDRLAPGEAIVLDAALLADRVKSQIDTKFGGDAGRVLRRLGRRTVRAVCAAPDVETLTHLFEITRTERAAARRIARVAEPATEAEQLQPEQLDSQNETGHITRVFRTVRHAFSPGSPVPLYSLIIDPSSFPRTVENLFYTSFLVRDGHLAVLIKQEWEPFVVPTASGLEGLPPEYKLGEASDGTHQQLIIELSYDDWELLRDAYTPLLEPQ